MAQPADDGRSVSFGNVPISVAFKPRHIPDPEVMSPNLSMPRVACWSGYKGATVWLKAANAKECIH
eukprot:3294501-Amphidinium_carterae.1